MGLNGTKSFLFLACFLSVIHGGFSLTEKSTYIVHMDKSFMPKAFASHHHWYSSMIDSTKLIHSYNNAFHGFSALMSKEELEGIKRSPGFVSAYPDRKLIMHTTHSTDFLKLNSASGLWPAAQYGKDVIIGVIDSGIWPESASFKDDGMTPIPSKWKGICQEGEQFNSSLCNLKLIGARYFNAGVRAADPTQNITMNSARDTYGHGTHVAGIAAGNYMEDVSFFGYAPGTARGVAPRARLAAYKVIWNEGSYASDALAAMDQAVADGVDIMSISLGYDEEPWDEYPLSIASFGAMAKGVLVSFSAGNRGRYAWVNNAYPWALTVGSALMDRWFAGTLTLGNGLTIIGWSMYPARASVRKLNLLYNKNISSCNSTMSIPDSGLTIIICEQDQNEVYDFFSQIRHVAESGPRAAIFINNEPGIFRSHSFPHPGVVISPKEGAEVIKYALNDVNPTATITFQETFLGTKPAPTVSSSSSRGPARRYPGLIMKPDIMAPGGLILAPMSPNRADVQIGANVFLSTNYSLMSGTSVACPHASGIAALLKAVHPEWSPSAIRSAMMTTAITIDNTGSEIKEQEFLRVATPLDMGAGFVDPNRAIDPGLIYDATPQDYVNLVCSMNFTQKQIQALTRLSNYSCSKPSSDLNYPSFIAIYDLEKSRTLVKKFQRTVTNVGDGAATYKAKLEAPVNATLKISPNTVRFGGKNEKQSFTLTLTYKSLEEYSVTHGSLTWIQDKGKHIVRSPIVVAPNPEFFG